jgi:hypothetical protein
VNSRVQGWVEVRNTERTTHAIVSQQIVENSSSEQLHQYTQYSTDPPQNHHPEHGNVRRVMQPIHVPKKSYQELEAELYKSKTHVSATNQDVVDGGHSQTFDHELPGQNDLNEATTMEPGVPNIEISQEDTEISRKDILTETTVVTVHKQVNDVADDQVSVSLIDDVPEKEHEENVPYENHQENRSELQVTMHLINVLNPIHD